MAIATATFLVALAVIATERVHRTKVASAIVGELPDGRPMLHRPDLAVRDDGRTIAIEVELTPKAPRRLERLVRSWPRAR
jgi:hypothetical protein